MHAMQYDITLPADYDMGVIRTRVATRGHLLDDFPGLGLKAYLMRERADGSPVNQYAPFYLWAEAAGMNAFLWGPGFQGIVNDFGRPVVQHWTVLAYDEGPATAAAPRTATRRRHPLPAGIAPADAVAEALERHAVRAAGDGVVATALAVDPRHWELLVLTVRADTSPGIPDAPDTDRFQVLHLSAPGRSGLGAGRSW
ncbi:hypothetical protein SLA_0561 [Streptomyces laurentii]|uniref:DUF4865 domain-containing protein n=1 Tax=Streptomyces laurentii TaxID=39478 RepID=A0A160NUL2_STRLU|nr:hypothetical protein SLA_0561 [Streptomyces laurentii]